MLVVTLLLLAQGGCAPAQVNFLRPAPAHLDLRWRTCTCASAPARAPAQVKVRQEKPPTFERTYTCASTPARAPAHLQVRQRRSRCAGTGGVLRCCAGARAAERRVAPAQGHRQLRARQRTLLINRRFLATVRPGAPAHVVSGVAGMRQRGSTCASAGRPALAHVDLRWRRSIRAAMSMGSTGRPDLGPRLRR